MGSNGIQSGVVGVVHRQDKMMSKCAEGCNNDCNCFGFQGWLRGGLGGCGHDAKYDSAQK